MKNLLIIAYYFPPSGGPGVQRVLKHVKYLSDFGWNPIVFTVSNGQFPAVDGSLMSQIPENVPVERCHIFEPYDLYRLLTGKKQGTAIDVNVIKKEDQKIGFKDRLAEFIRATFFIPDARMAWRLNAGKHLKKIIEKHKIDAIYSSSPPYTCSLIARNLKRKTGLPWIAGFRDPWTDFLTTPKRWFLPAAIDRSLEHSVFREADAIESAWEGITKDALKKFPGLDRSKFYHVPNGFDSADFPSVIAKRNAKFTLTYTGSMYGRRNPASLFEAIERLIERKLVKPDDFILRFIGRFGAEVEEMFEKATFKHSIEVVGYVAHEESIKYLLESDALLLVVDEAKESEEIVPGKVYEYVGTRKPIIAVGPERSAIGDLLDETGTGKIAYQSNIEGLAGIFLEYFQSWINGNINGNSRVNEEKIVKYERREAARSLAGILGSITNKQS